MSDTLNSAVQDALELTDLGNARRLAETHVDKIRYCHPWGKWLVWDGRRWGIDKTGRIVRLAKGVLNQICLDGMHSSSKDLMAHALKSSSASRVAGMIRLTESEFSIPVLPEELDTDPWLLNCANGTVDLRNGQLREACRDDLLTKVCPTAFVPDATAPTWVAFIESIFNGSAALIQFVQRLLGYSLTGDVSEQILAIFHGVGANGKSTLLNAVLDVLGSDYGIKAKKDLLVVKKHQEHSTEIMDLFGVRLAVCSETDDGQRLAEGFIKDLTGGDRIRGRRMREDTWEFRPSHKLVLATNHRPVVKGTDHAVWRRLRLVPFDQVFDGDKQDRQLPEKLKAEAEGILAWMLKGCLDWQSHGLGTPDEVETATAQYRSESDVLGVFIEECCLVAGTCKTRASDLYSAYRRWCERTGEHDSGQRRFGRAMTERGFTRSSNNGTWYSGIGIKAEQSEQQKGESQ
jgi:putative DNA primase/helicase